MLKVTYAYICDICYSPIREENYTLQDGQYVPLPDEPVDFGMRLCRECCEPLSKTYADLCAKAAQKEQK